MLKSLASKKKIFQNRIFRFWMPTNMLVCSQDSLMTIQGSATSQVSKNSCLTQETINWGTWTGHQQSQILWLITFRSIQTTRQIFVGSMDITWLILHANSLESLTNITYLPLNSRVNQDFILLTWRQKKWGTSISWSKRQEKDIIPFSRFLMIWQLCLTQVAMKLLGATFLSLRTFKLKKLVR